MSAFNKPKVRVTTADGKNLDASSYAEVDLTNYLNKGDGLEIDGVIRTISHKYIQISDGVPEMIIVINMSNP